MAASEQPDGGIDYTVELDKLDFRQLVDWWVAFFRDRTNIDLGITVDVFSDTKRDEIQIRAGGRLVMIGLIRESHQDEDAIEVTAQAVIMDLIQEHHTECRTFFVANAEITFFCIEQEDDVQQFYPIRQAENLDPRKENGLQRIRELFPQFLRRDARLLDIYIGQD